MSNATPARRQHVIGSDREAIGIAYDVAARLAREAIARDRDRRLPHDEMDMLSESGLLAISVPRSHGGAGASVATIAEVLRILSVADPAIGQLPQNHFVFIEAIAQDGSEAQKDFFYAELLAGARFGNAQAERGSGSALDMATRLLPTGDGYRLNGTKYYCTGAILADWIPVAALDKDDRQILAYVRRDAPGVEVLPDWNAIGQRTTFSGTTHLRDVAVEQSQVIPHWQLFDRPTLFHSFGVLLHAAVDVGIARAALEDTIRLIRSRGRPRLGAPVLFAVDDPHLLSRLGELIVRLHGLEALLAEAARLHDRIGRSPDATQVAEAMVMAGAAKAHAEDVGLEIASELFALTGSASTDAAQALDRHWRNLRTHSVHDANQWRYHQVGAWRVNGTAPSLPRRRRATDKNGTAKGSAA